MKIPLVLIAALAISFFSGCATITRGTKDTLVIESDPPGAKVTLSTGATGTTPTAFKLPRKHDLTVQIEKPGYEPLTIQVKSQISGAGGVGMAGNVLIGGLIGAGVDVGTGAMDDLRPNPIKVTLLAVKDTPDKPLKLPIAAVILPTK
jgi:hypothetical protein